MLGVSYNLAPPRYHVIDINSILVIRDVGSD